MLSFGNAHTALVRNGALYTAGANYFAQLLRGGGGDRFVTTHKQVEKVYCTDYSTWLSTSTGVYRSGPFQQVITGKVRDFVATEESFLAYLRSDGTYYDSEGMMVQGHDFENLYHRHGRLLLRASDGQGWEMTDGRLERLPFSDVKELAADNEGIWAVTTGGSLLFWDGEEVTSVTFPAAVTQVTTGNAHVLALLRDGSVWSRGSDDWGQLGTGARVDGTRNYFAPVVTETKAVDIFAGGEMSGLRDERGEYWLWGRNSDGQLGITTPYEGVVRAVRVTY